MKIQMTRGYEASELTTEELLGRMKLNHVDRHSPHSYHGCRSGIVAEQDAIIAELKRRGRGAETEGLGIR